MQQGRRYSSFVGFLKEKYGCRLQKLVVDAGFGCPNRDGTLSTGGCTYCDNAAFHPNYSTPDKTVTRQLDEGIEFHRGRYRSVTKYLAYFQAYSNTYGPLDKMRRVYEEALAHEGVVGIVVGTRPDCVDERKLDYLKELSQDKVVIVEYGIESCHDATLRRINRGHTFAQARRAVEMTAERGIMQGAHFIFGLPGEDIPAMMEMAAAINSLPLDSVKFHQLQIIKGTAMEREYRDRREDFVTFTLDGYIDFFVDFLERLRP
ncbi:MAG: TIGR01212 family radical SAM protein, partial [Bacteroidales bacterium]|nr:TIGR01212 family radical SAM protein [Bacteroidales bacterium]